MIVLFFMMKSDASLLYVLPKTMLEWSCKGIFMEFTKIAD